MVEAWLAYPVVLVAVAIGCGLLVDAICGGELPGILIASLGLAAVIVVSTLTTIPTLTAPATPWILVVLALLGAATDRRRLTALRLDPWVLAVGAVVYLACAAPVVCSGNATWLGYFVDNDPAFHFVLGGQLLAHGRNLSNVVPYPYSSPNILLHLYESSDYPVGTDVALAATAKLVGQNLAWLLQPYLAVILALGATVVYELIGVVRSRPLRALIASVASITGLVYAFYLEASLKELATAWLITLVACLIAWGLAEPRRRRAWLALVLAVIGEFCVLTTAAVPWFVLPLALLVVVWAVQIRRRGLQRPSNRAVLVSVVILAVAVVVAVPIVTDAVHFIKDGRGVLTASGNLGNLAGRLPIIEQFGIWPIGDFRQPIVGHRTLIHLLIAIAFASSLLGTAWCLRRRAIGPLTLILPNAVVAAVLIFVSSPYAEAKVMMIFSVSVTLAGMLGAAALQESGRGILSTVAAWTLGLVIAAGILWTDALGYRDASVAPRNRYAQLAAIGTRFRGQGPAFLNVDDEYAVWFLRQEGVQVPNTWGETIERSDQVPRNAGQGDLPWDPNDLNFTYLESFRLLVLVRSPQLSRPPANFRLVYQDRYYDVWRRTTRPTVLSHVPLTSAADPPKPLRCARIVALGHRATAEHARIAFAPRPTLPSLDPATASHPPDWVFSTENGEGDPSLLHLTQTAGAVTGFVSVSHSTRYEVWLEGSISEPISVWVGRRHIGTVSDQLAPPGQAFEVGTVRLHAGKQPVALHRSVRSDSPGDVFPGYIGSGELLGPLTLVPVGTRPAVDEIAPGQAKALCGRSLDWIEIVRR